MRLISSVRAQTVRHFTRIAVGGALAMAILASCSDYYKPRAGPMPVDIQARISGRLHPALRGTVGEYCVLVDSAPLTVEGWGLVVNLNGKGSRDMDPKIRQLFIEQFLRADAGSRSAGLQDIDPERALNTDDIAAVEVHGVIPPLARKGQAFDLIINAVPGSGTTSLADGILFTSELKIIATQGMDTRTIAYGRGPVFIPGPVEAAAGLPPKDIGETKRALRSGRVLGGGVCAEDRQMRLQLYVPNYGMSAAIERTINARFPSRDKVASVEANQGNSIIDLKIPPEYTQDPAAFVALVRHLYLRTEDPGFTEHKARELITAIQEPNSPHRDLALCLQGLGRSVLPDFIQPQYMSSDIELRMWCARAGANMQDAGGMVVLQEVIKDRSSSNRSQAIEGLVEASRGHDTVRASLTLSEMLNSPNTDDRVNAYRGLVSIRSRLVRTYYVGRKFYLDVVPSDSPPLIYATQGDTPHIALIGNPLKFPTGAAYLSPDKLLTVVASDAAEASTPASPGLNDRVLTAAAMGGPAPAVTARENVTLYWRSPTGKTVNIKTTSDLPTLISRITFAPDPRSADFDPKAPYIGASYQRICEMLATLCNDGTLQAKFVLEKAPPLLLTSSDIINNGRPEGSTLNAPTTAPSGSLDVPMNVPANGPDASPPTEPEPAPKP